jgi:hypothetical protein
MPVISATLEAEARESRPASKKVASTISKTKGLEVWLKW